MRLGQPLEALLGVMLAISYHRVHLHIIIQRRSFGSLRDFTDLAKVAPSTGKAAEAGKGGAGGLGKITVKPTGAEPSAKPHGFAAPPEYSSSPPLTPKTPEHYEQPLSPSHSRPSSPDIKSEGSEHHTSPVHPAHSSFGPEFIDLVQPPNDVTFLKFAQEVKEQRGVVGSIINSPSGSSSSTYSSRLSASPKREDSPSHTPRINEPGSPVRRSSTEIEEVEPHVPPTTSIRGATSPKHVESEHSINAVKTGSPDGLPHDTNPSPISKLNFLFEKLNTKYLKKIQTIWDTWVRRIFPTSSGSKVKTTTEAENVGETASRQTSLLKLMAKIRPNKVSESGSLASEERTRPTRTWPWLQSLGHKLTDSLSGKGNPSLFPSRSITVRTLGSAPDTRTKQQRIKDAINLDLALLQAGNMLAKPTDKLTPTTLTDHFLEEWRKQLSAVELENRDVIAEMKDTSDKFQHLMEAIQTYKHANSDMLKFASDIKQWKTTYLPQLRKALEATTSETVGKAAQTTEQALEKLGRAKLTQELKPKLSSIVENLSAEQQATIVNGLSAQKDYTKRIFRQLNTPQENLYGFFESKINGYTSDDIKAFAEARAGQQKSQISEGYQKKLYGNSRDPHRDALAELTVENLMKTLSTDVDLAQEFYLYRLIKGFEEVLEPLKEHAADYIRLRVRRNLMEALEEPEWVAKLPERYHAIVGRIKNEEQKGSGFEKLFRDLNGVDPTPQQLAEKLIDSGIKDQIAKIANNYPNMLTTGEIRELQVAAEASNNQYTRALDEVAKTAAKRFSEAYFSQLKQLPDVKSIPDILKLVHGRPAVIISLEGLTKDSVAAKTIPDFLDNLEKAGILTAGEHTRLISAVRVSYAHYLEELGDIPSTLASRLQTKTNENLASPLDSFQKAKIVDKAVDEITQLELLALDQESKEIYLDSKAFLKQGHERFVEAAKLYENKHLKVWLDRSSPNFQVSQDARPGFTLGAPNLAIESEFLNDLKIPHDEYTPYKPMVHGNPVFDNLDIKYLALYHQPLKVGDERLLGTRFEKLDGESIEQLNKMATAFGRKIEDLNEQAYRELKARTVAQKYREELAPYDQLITHALNSMASQYV